ncbi:MAG: ribonuclease D [Holophagales bacterium]|nr:ribonuclease D [Holophagales bacterium]
MTSLPRTPGEVRWHGVDRDSELARLCEGWLAEGDRPLAIDTEFVRERTFYPHLGLVQIADGDRIYLLDTEAIGELEPLAAILRQPGIPKIVHSCSEDLEVFHHRLGVLPEPIFDTQIAAGLAGLRPSMGYGVLVHELFGIQLPKAHTRSNWLKRPLSEAQLRYAALDVVFLLEIHRRLHRRLEDKGRLAWVQEDGCRLLDPGRFEVDGDEAVYRKIGRGRRLHPRQLAALRVLCAWRVDEARRRDLPRNFVLEEGALAPLTQRRPTDRRQLERIRELDRRTADRYGDTLLELIQQAEALPVEELPDPLPPGLDLTPHKAMVKKLRKRVAELAESLDLAPELLATRKTVEGLLRRHLRGAEPTLPRSLRGWRQEVVGRPLLELLATYPAA